MKFHRKALELFGQPDLPLDSARGAAAVRSAAALDVALPAAVAEWYCVPEQSELWRNWYAGCHAPAVWQKAGTNCMVRPDPPGDNDYREWWVNPPVRRDLKEWVKGPILPLMCENQGCWWWGVLLDGAPDPPAVISYDCGDTWDTCADAFSTYVYAIVFDVTLFSPSGFRRDFRVEECVCGERRRALREEFRIEPTTRGAGCVSGVFTERFSRPGQRFSFWNHPEHQFSCWRLWAADTTAFSDLAGRLCRILPVLNRPFLWDESRPSIPPGWSAGGGESGDGEIPF
jgi:hypothetical protein